MVSSTDIPYTTNKIIPNGNVKHARIINVTHMIPYTPVIKSIEQKPSISYNWILKSQRGHSALYSGLKSLNSDWDNHYVGYTGTILDTEEKPLENSDYPEELTQSLQEFLIEENVFPVFLEDSDHRGHYDGYCKKVLWPMFHYILWDTVTDGRKEKMYWERYVKVNQIFTDAIVSIYKPGDLVWIHDYHLLLVPQMLREKLPDAAIGLFIHTPFPSSEIFRCLPKRNEILNGMLGANQIGFQTYSYSRHFISNCTRILGRESTPSGVDSNGSIVSIGTFPIGIDVKKIEAQRKHHNVAPKIKIIKEMYADKKIIIGRDQLDSVKGVIQKLHSFEKLLEEYPEWRGNVVLIQVTSPAQRDSQKLELKVSELIARINGTYGSLEFTPVHHYHNHIDEDEYFALLSVADIGLITSVRDGMNTTSLEYIMCQQENHGPLILSEFTGMAGSLSAAILVNPWDYSGVAKAINDALNLPAEEKKSKQMQLYKHVTVHTAQFWAKSFVKELIASLSNKDQSSITPYLDIDFLQKRYESSKKRLLLFDYDGTLTPIVKNPSAATPPPSMLEALERLVDDPNNAVWVVSGRDSNALDNWLGSVRRLGFSAEHGSFIKNPDSDKWVNLTEDVDMSWKNDVLEIFKYYTERTQGSFIERKHASITWHYRQADPEYGAFQAKECQNHLAVAILPKLPVEILLGKKNLEVRPTTSNKGEIVKRLLATYPDVDFVFCAGDDRTDEDMFRALRRSELSSDSYFCTTIGTSHKKTLAGWHVNSPEELIRAMHKMVEAGGMN